MNTISARRWVLSLIPDAKSLPAADPAAVRIESLEARQLMAADAVLQWNDVLLDAVRVEKTAPPYAARNMAIVHAAVFDAVNAIEGGYAAYLHRRHGPKGASPIAAAAAAAHATLSDLYPGLRPQFDAELAESLAAVPDGRGENKGAALGRSVAHRILADRGHDGADDVITYVPGTGIGVWQPTPPAFGPAVLPHWPNVTPFAIADAAQFRPDGPPPITSAAFTSAFNEVKALGAADSALRTADQTQIALFWADGSGTATPPGHWNEIAQSVAEAQGNSLAENARLFALLNIAMADAGIACWDAKFVFNLSRPVTSIRSAATDGNAGTIADTTWAPLIGTPPFPAYVSGHSSFSAAAATVLAAFFETDDLSFTTQSDGLPGVTRSFTSFSDAAAEAGMSRIYGGIHWSFDNEDGLSLGQAIGELVVEEALVPLKVTGKSGKQ